MLTAPNPRPGLSVERVHSYTLISFFISLVYEMPDMAADLASNF